MGLQMYNNCVEYRIPSSEYRYCRIGV
jgi:hypothetical protein